MDELIDITGYCRDVQNWIGAEGIYPTPGLIRTTQGLEIFAAFAAAAPDIVKTAFDRCLDPEVQEIVIGLDTWCKPGQGTTLDSCLIVFHIRRGQPTRIGVLEYSWAGDHPVTKEIDWENPFWTGKYQNLARKFDRRINFIPRLETQST